MNEKINVVFIFMDYFEVKTYMGIIIGSMIVLAILFYILDRR